MTWTVNSSLRADGLVAQICTNLVAGGWTEEDGVNLVYSSTNNQGVTQYVQVSQSGTYTYIQLQGWLAWSGGAGTSGSGTTYSRLYLAASPIAAATTVDLYMSVTSNRAIIFIHSTSSMYRSWAYCGGLGSLGVTNDPGCFLILTSYETSNSFPLGKMLLPQGGSATYWTTCDFMSVAAEIKSNDTAFSVASISIQYIGADAGRVLLFPILCLDTRASTTTAGPFGFRGDLDGLLLCPLGAGAPGAGLGYGALSNLDTVVAGSTTYLIIQPGGEPTVNMIPFSGNFGQGLAIAEV